MGQLMGAPWCSVSDSDFRHSKRTIRIVTWNPVHGCCIKYLWLRLCSLLQLAAGANSNCNLQLYCSFTVYLHQKDDIIEADLARTITVASSTSVAVKNSAVSAKHPATPGITFTLCTEHKARLFQFHYDLLDNGLLLSCFMCMIYVRALANFILTFTT